MLASQSQSTWPFSGARWKVAWALSQVPRLLAQWASSRPIQRATPKPEESERIHRVQWSPQSTPPLLLSLSTTTYHASPALSCAAVLGEPCFLFLSKTSSDDISYSQGPQAQQTSNGSSVLKESCTNNLSPRCPLLPDPPATLKGHQRPSCHTPLPIPSVNEGDSRNTVRTVANSVLVLLTMLPPENPPPLPPHQGQTGPRGSVLLGSSSDRRRFTTELHPPSHSSTSPEAGSSFSRSRQFKIPATVSSRHIQ